MRGAESERHKEEEVGDSLFGPINDDSWKGIDPEDALERTNQKFRQRFESVEKAAGEGGLADMSLENMEALWQEAKLKA